MQIVFIFTALNSIENKQNALEIEDNNEIKNDNDIGKTVNMNISKTASMKYRDDDENDMDPLTETAL